MYPEKGGGVKTLKRLYLQQIYDCWVGDQLPLSVDRGEYWPGTLPGAPVLVL